MASENSARGQPNSVAMGIWNIPKLARMAKDSINTTQPAIRTGVTRGDFWLVGMARFRLARRLFCARKTGGSNTDL